MNEWTSCSLGDVCKTISDTYRGDANEVVLVNTSDVLEGKCLNHKKSPNKDLKGQFKKTFQRDDILYSEIRPVNKRFAYIDFDGTDYIASTKLMVIRHEENIIPQFLFYIITSQAVIDELQMLAESRSGTFPQITFSELANLPIELPPLSEQAKIVRFLKSLDDKIEVNRRINDNFFHAFIVVMLLWLLTSLENDNLEQQAQAIFEKIFPSIATGEDLIGNIITPKRGKGLLSKDAVEGSVPVVAGGLEPATYHNESNTIAPVVTISASGANAGYVNLWHIPVWSSDSSYIDSSMTPNVYFWYVMLKKRQKELFDAQTGSAQPHIYPKHVAEMPMGIFEQSDVAKFTEIVTPMFEIRGKNLKESERLASVRDSLLPKLMSGELYLDKVNV